MYQKCIEPVEFHDFGSWAIGSLLQAKGVWLRLRHGGFGREAL